MRDYIIQVTIPEDKYNKWKQYLSLEESLGDAPFHKNIKRLNSVAAIYGMDQLIKNPDSFKECIKNIKLYREC